MKKTNLFVATLFLGVVSTAFAAFSFIDSGVEWKWAEYKTDCHADIMDNMYQLLYHMTMNHTPDNAAVFLGPKNPKQAVPSGVLSVPRRVNGRPIVEIGNRAFEGHYELRTVNIPSTVRSIGIRAFSSCNYLETITIPESVVWFAPYCFSACNSLKSLPIPETGAEVTIETGVFSFCRGLTDIQLPERIKDIGPSAFANCENLSAVKFNGQTCIKLKAFENCKKLTRCDFPASLEIIGEEAFSGCSGLRSVQFKGKGPKLYNDSFCDCTALESVSLPERTVQFVVKEKHAPFSGCSKLKTIMVPERFQETDFDFLKPSPDCKIEFYEDITRNGPLTKNIPLSGQVSMSLIKLPNGLWFGKTEITQAQWEAVTGTPFTPDKHYAFIGPNMPVNNVDYQEVLGFIRKLNNIPSVKETGLVFDLPSDSEWEYACMSGSSGPYCKLEDGTEVSKNNLNSVAWFDDNSKNSLHNVGMKEPNAFGLYDMIGNVEEYTSHVSNDKKWTHAKGGHWIKGKDINVRALGTTLTNSKAAWRGFRICARDKAK